MSRSVIRSRNKRKWHDVPSNSLDEEKHRQYDDIREYEYTPALTVTWNTLHSIRNVEGGLDFDRNAESPSLCVVDSCSNKATFSLRVAPNLKYCVTHATLLDIASVAYGAETIRGQENVANALHESREVLTDDDSGDYDDNDDDADDTIPEEEPARKKRKYRSCMEEGCDTHPSYGEEGTKSPLYCSAHGKKRGMVNVKSSNTKRPPCLAEGCAIRPSYGVRGTKRGVYCARHGKARGMIYVGHRTCLEDECDRQPSYGEEGAKYAVYCAKHGRGIPGMVNVSKRRCVEPGCDREPTYGHSGTKRALCCAGHGRQAGMVNVVKTLCQHPECSLRASYAEAGSKKGLYCATHGKARGMVSVRKRSH